MTMRWVYSPLASRGSPHGEHGPTETSKMSHEVSGGHLPGTRAWARRMFCPSQWGEWGRSLTSPHLALPRLPHAFGRVCNVKNYMSARNVIICILHNIQTLCVCRRCNYLYVNYKQVSSHPAHSLHKPTPLWMNRSPLSCLQTCFSHHMIWISNSLRIPVHTLLNPRFPPSVFFLPHHCSSSLHHRDSSPCLIPIQTHWQRPNDK